MYTSFAFFIFYCTDKFTVCIKNWFIPEETWNAGTNKSYFHYFYRKIWFGLWAILSDKLCMRTGILSHKGNTHGLVVSFWGTIRRGFPHVCTYFLISYYYYEILFRKKIIRHYFILVVIIYVMCSIILTWVYESSNLEGLTSLHIESHTDFLFIVYRMIKKNPAIL